MMQIKDKGKSQVENKRTWTKLVSF